MSQLSCWKVLTRKKTLTNEHESETKLNRILNTLDLTALGVGATLGVGVYVLAGHVARDQAGPSVVLSFLIAALASLLAGLCYAEFGARVPKAGSAYIYSYVCIGEFAAFIIGWNLILEYIIGSASVCRGISLYLDSLVNDTLKITFNEVAPIDWGFLGAYFDFLAFALAITFGIGLAFGIQASTFLNNFCTIINIGVILFVVIAGSIKADFQNWNIDPNNVNKTTTDENVNVGAGGFFPFGFEGTLRGAATCFFGFVGFDCIATTGEEVKEPRKAIPRAILFSLLIIFLSYSGVSMVLTLMWPYYDQDINAPLPYAFEHVGWGFAKWIVTIGGMLGLIASLLGALFPLPRIIYAMSQDGLIFKFLGNVNFKTPIYASVCAAFLTAFFAGLFDLAQLVNMLSIGTLLAYTVIAICLTILRYMDNSTEYLNLDSNNSNQQNEGTTLVDGMEHRTNCHRIMLQIFNCNRQSVPNNLSTTMVTVMLMIYCACSLGFSLTLTHATKEILNITPWAITLLCIFGFINIFIVLSISVQPREENNPYFKVPLVPLIPAISIFVNIYLMLQLDIYTWIRFAIWMVIGLLIYLPCICLYDRAKSPEHVNSIESSYNSYSNQETKAITFNENEIEKPVQIKENETVVVLANGIVNKNELDQNSNEITDISNKSTSSPKQFTIDDIILESEFSDSLKEMKHSNGDRYLVEHITPILIPKDELEEPIPINEESKSDDTKSVLDILDNVLEKEEPESVAMTRKISVDSEQLPSFHNVSTDVLVHRPSDCFEEEPENEISNNNLKVGSKDSGIEDTDTDYEQTFTETPLEKNKYNNEPEISMATANAGLINLNIEEQNDEDVNFKPQSNMDIEQVLIPGSNILINSPKVVKSDKIEKENPNYMEDTPRPSIQSQIEENNISNALQENTEPKIIPYVIPISKTDKNSNEIPKEKTETPTEVLSENISEQNNHNIKSPTIKRSLEPLKSSKSPTLVRKDSTNSNKSTYENPLRSESFKEKLSKIFGQNTNLKINIPPPLPTPTKAENNEQVRQIEPKTAPAEISEQKLLKSSKSESDVMHLVSNDIKNKTNENDTNTEPEYSAKEASKTLNESKIPKPPKFDPILYKSLGANTNRYSKDRPKLDRLVGIENIKNNDKLKPIAVKITSKEDTQEKIVIKEPEPEEQKNTPEQFKKKLAALIQRGPSYKIQRQRQYPSANVIPVEPQQENKNESIEEILPKTKEITKLNPITDKNTHKHNYADVLQSIRDSKIQAKQQKLIEKNNKNDNISNKINKNEQNNSNEQINFEDVRKNLKSIT